jgi:hypothetical protein
MRMLFIFSMLFFVAQNSVLAAAPDWGKTKETHASVKDIEVHYSRSCGCCKKWMSHLRAHNFNVTPKPTSSMQKIKNKYAVAGEYSSCHTAIIGGYVIEGHVPADDIKRLLKEKPDIKGLSVPAMPVGTPGMEQGERKDAFYVITLPNKGKKVEIFHYYEKY